ncbi:MAG TPA: polyphosphate kinase 1 [Candidatus Coproplasma stercoravium]|nr:polyphosphate kinase 1 [Candidatus Coproplasma stercoravium]
MANDKTPIKLIKGVYVNRELSWIKFNLRVLEQAADEDTPVLERGKFLSIFTSNLDEFFMVRMGSLYNEAKMHPDACDNKTKLTFGMQLKAIAERTPRLYEMREHVFTHLKRDLSEAGINILTYDQLSEGRKDELKAQFNARVLPLLSPMVIDAKHPLLRFENLRCYMLYKLKKNDHTMIGVMEFSDKLDTVYRFSGGKKFSFITMEEVIRNLGYLAFPGYTATSSIMIRVTRNADIETYVEDADMEYNNDFSQYMKSQVETRLVQNAVRLEVYGESKSLMKFVTEALGIEENLIYKVRSNFSFKYLFSLSRRIDKELAARLTYTPFKPKISERLAKAPSMIDEVRKKDILLRYPFESMEPLIKLLNECADRKDCIAIKITIYRLADHSRIVEALKRASENGIDVTVVIELCARFDEENNLYFAGQLHEAGCNIIYGMENYKVHSKIISIVFSDEDGGISYITHLGTGNYNESTAKQYTDLNIITADRAIGEDGAAFFRNVSISNVDGEYSRLQIAPKYFKQKILECLDNEIAKAKAGKKGLFIGKMNSLTDKVIIDKLIEASCAGVNIKLIIRGICCFLPGKAGKTENISVISIVGRFLEHSRIYCFGEGKERVMYISSADLMTRNTDRRVEIATPVLDKDIENEIYKMLEIMLSDNVNARRLLPDGTYERVESENGERIDSQDYFLKHV